MGETLAVGTVPVPVPVKVEVWGLLLALSVTVNVPVRVPEAVGVKVTLMVQLPLPERPDPQLSVWLKSPVAAMLLMVMAVEVWLVRVIGCEVLEVPTAWLEKVRLVGAN